MLDDRTRRSQRKLNIDHQPYCGPSLRTLRRLLPAAHPLQPELRRPERDMAVEHANGPSLRGDQNLSPNRSLHGRADGGCSSRRLTPVCGSHDLEKAADLDPATEQRRDNRLLASRLDVDDFAGVVDRDAALERALETRRIAVVMSPGDRERELVLRPQRVVRIRGVTA